MSNDDILQVQDLRDGKLDITTIAEVAMIGTTADTTTNREGVTIDTLEGRLKKVGFEPPLPYAAGITFTDAQDAVKSFDNNGIVYGCLASSRPFTTTGNFQNDSANFFVIQDTSEIGDVRTSQDNTYDPGTNQSFDDAQANTFRVGGVDVTTKNNSQDSAISSAASAASAAQSTANSAQSAANTAQSTANSKVGGSASAVYAGTVDVSNAAGSVLPSGFSFTTISGAYYLTHSLGINEVLISLQLSAFTSSVGASSIKTITPARGTGSNSNRIRLNFEDTTPFDFAFTLTVIN